MELVTLRTTAKEYQKYEELADLFAIMKAAECLEKANTRDLVQGDDYTPHCKKLIQQFKSATSVLSARSDDIRSVDDFLARYEVRRLELVAALCRPQPALTLRLSPASCAD